MLSELARSSAELGDERVQDVVPEAVDFAGRESAMFVLEDASVRLEDREEADVGLGHAGFHAK